MFNFGIIERYISLFGVWMNLTIQIFQEQAWIDVAELSILDAGQQSVELEYIQPYLIEHIFEQLGTACGVNYPVEIIKTYRSNKLFGFLDDILPSGWSRRFWIARLDISHLSVWEQNKTLLQKATIAPVGNLRIKEAVPFDINEYDKPRFFTVDDVVERDIDFLEYAQELGAISGGATGAGGEAPKLLVRLTDSHEVWIDALQNDIECLDQHYIVKFPRGKRSQRDCDILRAEFIYLQELNALGISAIDVNKTMLIEGEKYPSLWLPRFDVTYFQAVNHLGMESVYSILEKGSGAVLNHFEVIDELVVKLSATGGFNVAEFVIDWVKRDLLNVMFANSDNHGRNFAFIKDKQTITLSPVYDFAPMRADPDGVVRSIKWGQPYEIAGEFDWKGIVNQLEKYVESDVLWYELRALAKKLVGLKQRLKDEGIPQAFLDIPVLGMNTIESRLERWQLI